MQLDGTKKTLAGADFTRDVSVPSRLTARVSEVKLYAKFNPIYESNSSI